MQGVTPQQVLTVLHDLVPLGMIGLIRHLAWIIKLTLSSRWRDIRSEGPLPYTKVAVATTVKGEPEATFQLVLEALLREKIEQVCITFDKGEKALMELTDRFTEAHRDEIDIRWMAVMEKGKRKGLKAAIEMVDGMDIIICMDSDTIFGPGVKDSIMHAFSKPGIGGVTVAQRAHNPHKLMHYMFDIRLKLRYLLEIPGQALTGHVSCLSGRCSAYLAEPLKQISANLTTEQWLGIKKTGGGEDKCLTTFIQDAGYKCAVVVNSTVYTRPEDTVSVYFSQSLRWARNSWFSDLRALATRRPWMVRDPVMMFYTLDRMMSTFTLIWAAWYMIFLLFTHRWAAAGLLFTWWLVSRAVKTAPWLVETRKFWVVIPYAFMTFWLSFIKVHALVTLWETGWLTREAGLKVRAFSKMLVNNTYRFVTFTVIVVLGVWLAHNRNIWLADMPNIADIAHLYRPGDSGLVVMQDVFPHTDEHPTLLVMNDPLALDRLKAAVPTLVRLGDELSSQVETLQIVRSADLTEAQAATSNLVFLGKPQPVNDVTRTVNGLYERPARGDRLLNTEPFASVSDMPIRIVRAPWNSDTWVMLADDNQQMRYRLLGEVVDPARAVSMVQNNLGADFFTANQTSDTSYTRELSDLDSMRTSHENADTLERTYRLLITPDVDVTQLVLNIGSEAAALLTAGTQIEVRLNADTIGAVVTTSDSTPPPLISLGDRLKQIISQNGTRANAITFTVIISRAALRDASLAAGNFWHVFDAHTHLTWKHTQSFSAPGLNNYPFPFISLDEKTPLAIILPDALTDTDVNLLARLVTHLGANGLASDDIHIMQASSLDTVVLQTANVIMLGSNERQPLVQMLNRNLRQTNEIGLFDILPNSASGFVLMNASPWNPKQSMILATGTTETGEALAAALLFQTSPLTDIRAGGAIVNSGGTITPYTGFDKFGLLIDAPSVQSAAAPTPLNHGK